MLESKGREGGIMGEGRGENGPMMLIFKDGRGIRVVRLV